MLSECPGPHLLSRRRLSTQPATLVPQVIFDFRCSLHKTAFFSIVFLFNWDFSFLRFHCFHFRKRKGTSFACFFHSFIMSVRSSFFQLNGFGYDTVYEVERQWSHQCSQVWGVRYNPRVHPPPGIRCPMARTNTPLFNPSTLMDLP